MSTNQITRRFFLHASAATGLAASTLGRVAFALPLELPHRVAGTSPWFCNQVALTSKGQMFLGLPRYPDHDVTPSVARCDAQGVAQPFPGNGWNDWKPGDDGQNAFVYVNSLHIFHDDTVWAVDQGSLRADSYPPELSEPKPGAQKLVQLNANTGAIVRVIRWGEDMLPRGAKMNDLRIFGDHVYVTDSGLGALIYHNLKTGQTLRRLSGHSLMNARVEAGKESGNHKTPKIDMIEVSSDGQWLYAAAPPGPFIRVRTADLRDATLSEEHLAERVEHYADIARTGGCAIDTMNNLYLSELDNKRISILAADGRTAVLTSDDEFISPDGSFIGVDRTLYLPVTQSRRTRLFGNPQDMVKKPWKIYAVDLPESFSGIVLGNPVST